MEPVTEPVALTSPERDTENRRDFEPQFGQGCRSAGGVLDDSPSMVAPHFPQATSGEGVNRVLLIVGRFESAASPEEWLCSEPWA
jgi:hypothetical protein